MDEAWSGVLPVGAPEVQNDFELTYGMAAGWTLSACALLAVLVEPPLLVLADRHPRRWFLAGSTAFGGVCMLMAGVSPRYPWLLGALLLCGPASGCMTGLARAALVDAQPEARERAMTRWTFWGYAGDLATPALLALLSWLAMGWREALVLMGIATLMIACWIWRRPGSEPPRGTAEPDDSPPPVAMALRGALRNRRLVLWLLAVTLCGLLDEIVVAFGALQLETRLGLSVRQRSLVLVCWMLGSMAGLLALDRLLRRLPPLRLLQLASLGGGAAYFVWLGADSVMASALWSCTAGFFCAALYPLAQAQAFRALPEQSGMVTAIGSLLGPVDIALPLLVGVIADRLGLPAAMLFLGVQPIGLLLLATWTQWRDDRRGDA